MKDDKHEAKVIQFPGNDSEKATLVAERTHHEAFNNKQVQFKKPMVILASTVLMATLFNYFVPQATQSSQELMAVNSKVTQSRSLASIGDSARSLRDPAFEKNLAQKLSTMSSRDIASVGRVPTFEDRLRFGYLEGKYALRMNAGKISEIEFASSPDAPKYLNDRVEFLTSHKNLLPVDFEQAKNVSREVLSQRIHETYQLVQGDKVEAEVSFELDLYGRLLSMKVESLTR